MSRLRGRFGAATGVDMQSYSSSIEVDLRMWREDLEGSLAHVQMLGEQGLVSADDATALAEGLRQVGVELAEGKLQPGDGDEDIHMAIEARLTELLGEVGGRLHTARSRNDQVATDVRLWLKRHLAELDGALVELLQALLERVESADGQVLMPGYTHLQRGQPILLGHQLLAHAWTLHRDRGRFRDALTRLDESPLGACAMAGTPHPIDRRRTAELLGFAGVAPNAMDAVAARDHEQEVAAAAAICATHLTRMAEELVLWSSSEFAFVRLGEAYATGSSIMPQKRNPDAAELVRGKASRVVGDLIALLHLTKGLPLAYNRDLQEDREPLFDAVETVTASLAIMAGCWRTLEVRRERFEAALVGDFSLATELADLMAAEGVPFREAHEVVGRIVRWCEEQGTDLTALIPEIAGKFHPTLERDLSATLDPRRAAERRTSEGGTAPAQIAAQVKALRQTLEARERSPGVLQGGAR